MTGVEALLEQVNHQLADTVNARNLLALLQKLSAAPLQDLLNHQEKLMQILSILWNHDQLFDDCILVSGILHVRLAGPSADLDALLRAESYSEHKHADWVFLGVICGILIAQFPSESLAQIPLLAANEITLAIQKNRLILVARHLENIIQYYQSAYKSGLNPSDQTTLIISILAKTLLLKSDLVEYKSRDLIKLHYQALSGAEAESFISKVIQCMPDIGKVAVQCYDTVLDSDSVSAPFIHLIFTHCVPLIKMKGLGAAAAKCVAKALKSLPQSEETMSILAKELAGLPSSKDKLVFAKGLFAQLDVQTRFVLSGRLSLSADFLAVLSWPIDQSVLERLLKSADEYVSFEAFSVLVRESQALRRKPVESIAVTDLSLFSSFLRSASFSGSVEFRQKVIATSKCFYDQVYARIYHLIRESHKNRNADVDALKQELDVLFDWLAALISRTFIEPFDFVSSNFCSLEFAFRQILAIMTCFEGNSTLAGANQDFLLESRDLLMKHIIHPTIHANLAKFTACVGRSTYDGLRLLAIEILCKSKVDQAAIDLAPFQPLLHHPRAINNEGAARMYQLHSKLSGPGFTSKLVLDLAAQLESMYSELKASFPANLMHNNVNGRLLALRFLLHDRPSLEVNTIVPIITLAIDLGKFVASIASHPSPEGLDLEEQAALVDADDDGDVDECPSNTTGQYVLSFSWRAIKEGSCLLETIILNYHSSLNQATIDAVSEHFIHLLLTLRHRGAFSSVEGPLSTILRLCFPYSKIKSTLSDVLHIALGTEEISCTRRSAGLPHLILSIVHSCVKSSELGDLLGVLLPSLAKTIRTSDHSNASVIHAFNITRSLVRDSKIAPELSRYLGLVAQMCLETFNSPNWSVRNASSMLLSSLIARVFGTTHLNDSACDQIDVRELEVKFDGLLGVLQEFMKESLTMIDPIDARLAYPMLATLERIKIPMHERFIPFKCLVLDFLFRLVADLGGRTEHGRKLIHVIARVLVSLLVTQSLAIASVSERMQELCLASANASFNYLMLLQALKDLSLIDSNQISVLLERVKIESGWNPVIRQSHNLLLDSKCCPFKKAPVQR